MTINTYVSPKSWNDLGMDWTNPDPFNAVYYDAIARATYERYLAVVTDAFYVEPFRFITSSSKLRKTGYKDSIYASLIALDNYIKELFLRTNISFCFLNPNKLFNIELIQAGDSQIYANNVGIEYQNIYNKLTLNQACEILGYTKLISPQPYFNKNSEWLKQCYNLLNLIKFSLSDRLTTIVGQSTISGKKRTVVSSNDPDIKNKDVIEDLTNLSIFAANSVSTSLQNPDYYYYNSVSTEIYINIGFYSSAKYRVHSYVKKWEPIISQQTEDYFFKSNEVSYAGYYWINTPLTGFTSGIQKLDVNLTLGDLSLLPYPPLTSQTKQNYSSQTIDSFIIEFDFDFKSP